MLSPFPAPSGAITLKTYDGLGPVMSNGDIAWCFGVSGPAVTHWTKTPDFPEPLFTTAGGIYPTEKVLEWAKENGKVPVHRGRDVLSWVEPLAARRIVVFEASAAQFHNVCGHVQVQVVDLLEIDDRAFPGMAVWLEGPDDQAPTVGIAEDNPDLLLINGHAAAASEFVKSHASSPPGEVIDLNRDDEAIAHGAADTGLAPDQTRVTIAVPRGTSLLVTDRQATYLIGDTEGRLDITGSDLTVRAGRVGATSLSLRGSSSAQIRHVKGRRLNASHESKGETTILDGDVRDLFLNAGESGSVTYGGTTKVARMVNAGDGVMAVNEVTGTVYKKKGNVYVHVSPQPDRGTFWAATQRQRAAARNQTSATTTRPPV